MDEQLEDDPSSWPTLTLGNILSQKMRGEIFFTRNDLYDKSYTLEDGVLTFKKAPDADSGDGNLPCH